MTRNRVSTTILLGLLLAALVRVDQGRPASTNGEGSRGPFAVAANAFRTEVRAGEPLPVVVALGYAGNTPVCADMGHSVRVAESTGKPVPGPPSTEPPPPPGNFYMTLEGERTFVVPVRELPPGGGIVDVESNALEGYKLTPGTYTIVEWVGVSIYSPDSVLVRPEQPQKNWVRPEKAVSRVRLFSNPVTIELK